MVSVDAVIRFTKDVLYIDLPGRQAILETVKVCICD